jgi:hypothetical protein
MPLTFKNYYEDDEDEKYEVEKYEVKNLTGPTSLHILNPTEDFLTRNPYAPIFILFGDYHFSTNNYCKLDTGEDDDGIYDDNDEIYDDNDDDGDYAIIRQMKHGIYRVFNKYFLRLLSDIVDIYEDNDNVVDFYIEGGEFHKMNTLGIAGTSEYPMTKFWRWFTKCYYNERMEQTKLQSKYGDFCIKYAKNIRWQSGDTRFFEKTKKMKLDLGDFLEDFIQKYKSKYVFRDFDSFYNFCHEELLGVSRNTQWRIDLEKARINPSEIFNEYVQKRDSLIRKQLDKIVNETIKKQLNQRFDTYIQENYKNTINEKNKDFFIKSFRNFQNLLKCEPHSNDANEKIKIFWDMYDDGTLENFKVLLIYLRTPLTDLYMIARSYKIMDNLASNPRSHANKPLINAVYFGALHTKNMKDFLIAKDKITNETDYNLLVDISIDITLNSDDKNRCLKIEKNLDMDGLINRLIARREEHEEKNKMLAKRKKYRELAKIRT